MLRVFRSETGEERQAFFGPGAQCDWTKSVTGNTSLSQSGGCRSGGGGGGTKSPKEHL